VLYEANVVPSPRASARWPASKSTIGRSKFGDLALHGDNSLGFFYPEIESTRLPLAGFPVKTDTWSTYGLIADVEVFVAGPDDLTDESLADLDHVPETRLRPEAFGFGELGHAI